MVSKHKISEKINTGIVMIATCERQSTVNQTKKEKSKAKEYNSRETKKRQNSFVKVKANRLF